MTGVVVANPSSNPEMVAAASGLARAGLLGRYHVPFAFDETQYCWLRRLPKPISSRAATELRRRPIPSDVPRELVRRTALVSDLVRVAVARSPHIKRPQKVFCAYRHAALFDSATARSLRPADGVLLAVAGEASRRTLATARSLGLQTWLDFPLPHHASMVATLREEILRVPEYASTMQVVSSSDPSWLTTALHRQALEADHVLVLSSYARDTFEAAGVPSEKMHLTPLGVDIDLFYPVDRAADGVFRIAFVGQITQRKGVSYLVDAFRVASINHSQLVFTGAIVGNAPWAGVAGVRHQPARPRAQLPAVYADADVTVLPSLADGFGLTALEAMACGRPVIVSDHTFGNDLIEDGVNGWTVPIRDADAIADRLILLAEDPERRRLMGAAARRTAEQFTWEHYSARLAQLIGQESGSSSWRSGEPRDG